MTVTVTKESLSESPRSNGVTKVTLGAGDTSDPVYVPDSCVVCCVPGSGGTMKAQASWSLPTEVSAGTATWHDWDAGTVSAKATQLLLHATAVRFTATGQAGVGEVAA